jgi:hypothetical protein
MFIDRDDILNLYVVTNLPLPAAALPPTAGLLICNERRRSGCLRTSSR